MVEMFGVEKLGALIRRRGIPQRPVAAVQVSEIRSDQFLDPIPTLETQFQPVAIAPLVIEWQFVVQYQKMAQLQEFLAANEAFIAEGCKRVMSGVSYHGTYLGAAGQRNSYRTLWGYQSWQSLREWTKVVDDSKSQLFEAVRSLRSYWTADAGATQQYFAYAAMIKPTDYPFLDLTIRAATS
jgi:hypothetical protein